MIAMLEPAIQINLLPVNCTAFRQFPYTAHESYVIDQFVKSQYHLRSCYQLDMLCVAAQKFYLSNYFR